MLKRSIIAALYPLTLSGVVQAENLPAQLRSCMQVADSLHRLHCFETVTRNLDGNLSQIAPTAPRSPGSTRPNPSPSQENTAIRPPIPNRSVQPGKTEVGTWKVNVETNPIGGGANVFLRNLAVQGRNKYAAPIELTVNCNNGAFSANIKWRQYLITNEPINISVDGQHSTLLSDGFRLAKNNMSWHFSGDATAFADLISGAAKLTTSAGNFDEDDDPSEEELISVEMDLTGAQWALKPLRLACGI